MINSVLNIKQKAGQKDVEWSFRLNRWSKENSALVFFRTISRLGDGVLWYSLMLVFPVLYGAEGFVVTAIMLLMASWGVWLYRAIKKRSMRPRPFRRFAHIKQGARALDEFSFPSGHTMHAVAFTIVLGAFIPWLLLLLIPFTLLTGLARVVLGLHYPSDVVFGASLGAINGVLFLNLLTVFL